MARAPQKPPVAAPGGGVGDGESEGRSFPPFLASPLFQLALIAFVGLAGYANIFHAPFTFDDQSSIIENPVIKDLDGFLSGEGYRFNPRRFVGYLSLALNYHFGGLDVVGYHVVNLLIHLGAAVAVWGLCRVTFRTPHFKDSPLSGLAPWIALGAGLLFVAHPVQTQAVTYTVQRLASMAAFFYLLSLLLYAVGRLKTPGLGTGDSGLTAFKAFPVTSHQSPVPVFLCFFGSLVFALLAMKTKENAFTLPLAVILYELCFFPSTARRKRLFLLLPLLALVVVPLGFLGADRPIGDLISDVSAMAKETDAISRPDYLFTQFRVIVTYIRLIFLPVGQNIDYAYPIHTSFFDPPVFLSFLFLLGILGIAIRLYGFRFQVLGFKNSQTRVPSPESRIIAFGILFFFLALSVESSVIPIRDVIFEHRLYLPMAGAAMALSAAFFVLLGRYPAKVWVVAGAIIVLALSTATFRRNLLWGDPIALWQDAVEKSPAKARTHSELGAMLTRSNRPEEGIRRLRNAIALNPNYLDAHINLGGAYFEKGAVEEAIEEFRAVLRLQPSRTEAHNNLGAAYDRKGMLDEAIEEYRTVLRQNPKFLDARANLGMAYYKKGMTEEAIEEYRGALRIDPDHLESRINLGVAYDRLGRLEEAVAEYRRALELSPENAALITNLGTAYHKLGQRDRAEEQYRRALQLRPDFALAHNNLGMIHQGRGEWGKAVELYREAVRLDPARPLFRNNLDRARAVSGLGD